MERETGFEPATSTLARSHSTTELFPLATNIDHIVANSPQQGSGEVRLKPDTTYDHDNDPQAGLPAIAAKSLRRDGGHNLGTVTRRSTSRRSMSLRFLGILEAPPGFEPGVEVLQTSALPLGDGAFRIVCRKSQTQKPAVRLKAAVSFWADNSAGRDRRAGNNSDSSASFSATTQARGAEWASGPT